MGVVLFQLPVNLSYRAHYQNKKGRHQPPFQYYCKQLLLLATCKCGDIGSALQALSNGGAQYCGAENATA